MPDVHDSRDQRLNMPSKICCGLSDHLISTPVIYWDGTPPILPLVVKWEVFRKYFV